MALRRPNLPLFAGEGDQLSPVDVYPSSNSSGDPLFVTETETTVKTSQLFNSPNGHKPEMSLGGEGCSSTSDSYIAESMGQLDQEMLALTVHGKTAVSQKSPTSPTSTVSMPHTSAIDSGSDSSSVEMRCTSTRIPTDRSLRSPINQGCNVSRSPARESGTRAFSLVEERAKRYSQQKPSGCETRKLNNGVMTLPASIKPVANSSSQKTKTVHTSTTASSHGVEQPVKPDFGARSADSSDVHPEEPMWSRKTACQAPPVAEVLSLPMGPSSAIDTLPGIFEEQIMLFEQSLRVEPSPERILGPAPMASREEEIELSTVNPVESALQIPDSDTQTTTTSVRTMNAPKKLKSFFGDSIQVDDYTGSFVDTTIECLDATQTVVKKELTTRVPVDSSKGKKPWVLTAKSHGASPVSPRPRKPQNDREPNSSPKQKDHKTPMATPPAVANIIPSPPQPTWKDRVVNPFKRIGSGSALTVMDAASPGASAVTGVIGVPLCLCQSGSNKNVPLIVELCTKIVEEKGLENQGIYRVPGNTGALNSLIEELNKDPFTLCQDNDKWQDVNVVSSLLKLFLRKLPDSLITDELYGLAITANHTENSERRMLKLKKILHDLSELNFETFKFLAQHLARVASREEVNKMDARNLAIMFGPSLVRPLDDSMVAMVRDMSDQCRIVESIILHCDWFFSSWDEDVNVPVDEEADDSTPISGSNQIMLAKAESLVNSIVASSREAQHASVLQSIIQAANRKKRNKDKGGKSAVNQLADGDSPSTKSKLPSSLQKSKTKEMKRNKSAENIVELVETSSSVDTVSETSADASEVEISFEIVRYPAYRFKDAGAYCIENAKPRSVRRAKSNDCLLTPKLRVANPAYIGSDDSPPVDQQRTDSQHDRMNSSASTSITLPYGSSPVTQPYGYSSMTVPYGSSSVTLPYGYPNVTLPYGTSSMSLPYGAKSATLPYGSPASTATSQHIGAAVSSEWGRTLGVPMYSPQQSVNNVSSHEDDL